MLLFKLFLHSWPAMVNSQVWITSDIKWIILCEYFIQNISHLVKDVIQINWSSVREIKLIDMSRHLEENPLLKVRNPFTSNR